MAKFVLLTFQASLLQQIDMSHSIGQDILPRFSHTAHLIGKDKLLIIGGLTSLVERPKKCSGQTVGVFNLNTLEFQEYQIINNSETISGTPLLFNHTSFCDIDTRLMYIFGGGSNCFSFGNHMNHSILRLSMKNIWL